MSIRQTRRPVRSADGLPTRRAERLLDRRGAKGTVGERKKHGRAFSRNMQGTRFGGFSFSEGDLRQKYPLWEPVAAGVPPCERIYRLTTTGNPQIGAIEQDQGDPAPSTRRPAPAAYIGANSGDMPLDS